MSTLSYTDGLPVCKIYKDPFSQYGDSKTQGPTIAFDIHDSEGRFYGKTEIEFPNNIQIRTGGICNPGGVASALRIQPKEMRANFRKRVHCGTDIDEINGKPTGIVRVSLGAMSSMRDVDTFMRFLGTFLDTTLEKRRCLHPLTSNGSADKSSLYKRGDGLGLSPSASEGDDSAVSAVGEKCKRWYSGCKSWLQHWRS